jgi:hypothetical protein
VITLVTYQSTADLEFPGLSFARGIP